MHGRLKVRTSAEEAERKKNEQKIKVAAYRSAMTRILEKRTRNELDDDMINLCCQVLTKNPDIYTLWNIRKDCILKLDLLNDDLFLTKELYFTEQCLRVNPKSYNAWHHRCWILENCPNPDWNKEVAMCSKYLTLDERNFHCWDYRRFVCEKAQVPAEDELDFCTKAIRNNFSNYSSWHYRSKLLPKLYPHEECPNRPISEEKLKDDLELVLSAAFTDPNDSSAWFYQRWLLGYSEPELNICAFRINNEKAVIGFTKVIDINCVVITSELTDLSNVEWKPSRVGNKYDNTWIAESKFQFQTTEENFTINCAIKNNANITISVKKITDGFIGLQCPKFEYEFGAAVLDELNNQLNSCEQLLEYEPDSKWTLLTAALLMRAIDRKKYHQRSIELLTKLETIDNLRVGYYSDLSSKWKIEFVLEQWAKENCLQIVDLSGLNLTSIFYEQYFCIADEIDLSDNKLTNRSVRKLITFQFVKTLKIAEHIFTDNYEKPNLIYLNNLIVTTN